MSIDALPAIIGAIRESYEEEIARLPATATTDAQRALQEKHGTPQEFARAVVRAIPEFVSDTEANAAIEKYTREWKEAE